jgi:hypothetical protein
VSVAEQPEEHGADGSGTPSDRKYRAKLTTSRMGIWFPEGSLRSKVLGRLGTRTVTPSYLRDRDRSPPGRRIVTLKNVPRSSILVVGCQLSGAKQQDNFFSQRDMADITIGLARFRGPSRKWTRKGFQNVRVKLKAVAVGP